MTLTEGRQPNYKNISCDIWPLRPQFAVTVGSKWTIGISDCRQQSRRTKLEDLVPSKRGRRHIRKYTCIYFHIGESVANYQYWLGEKLGVEGTFLLPESNSKLVFAFLYRSRVSEKNVVQSSTRKQLRDNGLFGNHYWRLLPLL